VKDRIKISRHTPNIPTEGFFERQQLLPHLPLVCDRAFGIDVHHKTTIPQHPPMQAYTNKTRARKRKNCFTFRSTPDGNNTPTIPYRRDKTLVTKRITP